MQVKSVAECSIKLPLVIRIFIWSIFEWPFYTGFTVVVFSVVDGSSVHVLTDRVPHIRVTCSHGTNHTSEMYTRPPITE